MKLAILLGCLALPILPADKLDPIKDQNEKVEIVAALHATRDAAKAQLGVDPEMDIYIVEVKLRPRGDSVVRISRDDFTLISRRDGQKTQAIHPSQIAGPATLVVASSGPGAGGGVIGGQRRGPIWGGIPGTGDRPRRIGGDDEGAIASTTPAEARSTIENKSEESPVLAALKAKELPLGESNEPSAGLLYFLLEGKHKPKDLELIYKAPGGTMILDFQK